MTPRILGISRIAVSPIGLGCMGITHASGAPLSQAEGVRVIRQALDLGYTFFDTAECYTGLYPDGATAWNEDVVGEALTPVRHEVVIATKFGVHHGEGTLLLDSRPQTIRAALEGRLRRLRTDYVDLYYQHRIDPKVEPETVASVMADLIREGKIRAWGISEATEDYLRRAHAVCPVSVIQNRWSMMARWHAPLLPVAEELGIAWVAFSPLANGFLTACYDADTPFEAGTDYRPPCPSTPKRAWPPRGTYWPSSGTSPGKRTPPRRRSPWRGSSAASPFSFPSRGAAARTVSGKTGTPPGSSSPRQISPASTAALTQCTSSCSAAIKYKGALL